MAAEFKIKAWDAPYNIAKVIFALKNNNKFPSKIFAPSGSVLDIKRETLFEILRPGQVKTFKAVNLGFVNEQAKSVGCEPASFVWA